MCRESLNQTKSSLELGDRAKTALPTRELIYFYREYSNSFSKHSNTSKGS